MSRQHIVKTLKIPVVTLKRILGEHLAADKLIDFLSVDVEGFDHEVISSNDWAKYRLRFFLVELLETEMQNITVHPTAQVLFEHNYRVIAKTHNTYFFVANETIP
jgi:hypothetical protein